MEPSAMHSPARLSQRGFTLVELMVGLVLGLLTVLVITQVLALAEGKKRTTAMGSDAQINGALALYTLQREIQAAGYGASSNPAALGCPIKGKFTGSGASPTSSDVSLTLAPVVIASGANGAPDTITLLQSQTSRFSTPIRVTETHDKSLGYFVVQSTLGVTPGDLLVAVPPNPTATDYCTLFAATNNTGATETTLSTTRIPHTAAGNPTWNSVDIWPDNAYEGAPISDKLPKSYLLNLGKLTSRVYSISSNHDLQVTAMTSQSVASAPTSLFSQIVNMKALYGKDTNADGAIDLWDNVTPTSQALWSQVVAVRVAVAARSNQYEKEAVTTANPQWDVGGADTITGVTTVNCAQNTNKCITLHVDQLTDWQHYRYKVFDVVIPLRNMIWSL